MFVAALLAALPLLLYWGRDRWFFYDEWDFLVTRDITDAGDLFRPHNVHWSTLPIVGYRTLFRLFGVNTYVPYQGVLVLAHLTAAALLRVVIRRAGVDPWIATGAAVLFAFFGAGVENVLWAFQIGFTGALVFGLVHLLLADHDGPFDRRDVLGIAAGAASLMCSGVGVTMVFVVGLATLLRRGWQIAAVHIAPLGATFALWWLFAPRGAEAGAVNVDANLARFVATGLGQAFDGLGGAAYLGWLVAGVLVVGLLLAWRPLGAAALRQRYAATIAMGVGAVAFFVISGSGRAAAFGPDFARASRYVHLGAALMLPALAVAVDAVVRRGRLATIVLALLFAVSLAANVDLLANPPGADVVQQAGNKRLLLGVATSPLGEDVPRSVRPSSFLAPQVTMGWIRDAIDAGRFPDDAEPDVRAETAQHLALQQTRARLTNCTPLTEPLERTLRGGEAIGFTGGPLAARLLRAPDVPAPAFVPTRYEPDAGNALTAVAGPLTLKLTIPSGDAPPELCDVLP